MPAPWLKPGDPALYRSIASVWEFGQRVGGFSFPPAVYKQRSIEDMNRLDEEWAAANFRAFWRRRQAAAGQQGRR